MNRCFHAADPLACEYFPRCSKGFIDRFELEKGEVRLFDYPGPCILYIHCGALDIDYNNASLNVAAPGFIIVPDIAVTVTATSPTRVHLFLPDALKQLADKLHTDYYKTRGASLRNAKPFPLLGIDAAGRLSQSIPDGQLDCRHYAEIKFRELILTIDPGCHRKIIKALISKRWFFRLRVAGLLDSCGSLQEYAYSMGLSLSGFSKAFRRIFGESFYQWFCERKFEAIMRDMLKTCLPLKELAGKHGFSSVQHFGSFIKKRTGVSAGKFRKELIKTFSAHINKIRN